MVDLLNKKENEFINSMVDLLRLYVRQQKSYHISQQNIEWTKDCELFERKRDMTVISVIEKLYCRLYKMFTHSNFDWKNLLHLTFARNSIKF